MTLRGKYSRNWHYLTPNKKSGTPTNFAFIDTSTYSIADAARTGHTVHRLSRWSSVGVRLSSGRWTRRAERSGDTITGFWEWLYSRLDRRRPLWLWGYGISQHMQLLSMGTEIERGALEWQTLDYGLSQHANQRETVTWQGVVILDDPPTVIELRHPRTGSKLWIADTLNFWRCDREEFLAEFCAAKNNSVPTAAPSEGLGDRQEDILACTERAVTTLVSTIRERDLGNMRWTVSAQGLQAYRHRFMRHKILVHCDPDALQMERDGYFGGTVSLYQYGLVKGPIYVCDYQSYYPAIMASYYLPVRWLGSASDPVRCSDLSWCADCWRVARVTLNTTGTTYPVRYRGRLVLAAGNFATTLHEPELLRATSEGSVARIHSVSWYTRAHIFSQFVPELWGYRQAAKRAGRDLEARLYKLMLNGVPGKFGQRQINWVDEPTYHATRAWGSETVLNCDTGRSEHLRYLNWRVQRERPRGERVVPVGLCGDGTGDGESRVYLDSPVINDESSNSVPQIAGAITSWGREILYETIAIAGAENVYYTDTDCLHVNRSGFLRLEQAGKIKPDCIGALDIKVVASEAEYRGVKHYRLDDCWTVSGRKSSGTVPVNGKWEQSHYSGWSSLLYDGLCGRVDEYRVQCDRSEECIPGTVLPDGRVTPIRLALSAPTQPGCALTD